MGMLFGVALAFRVGSAVMSTVTSVPDVSPCSLPWWQEVPALAAGITGAPLQPTLLVPFQWPVGDNAPVFDALTIQLTDPEGQLVTGSLASPSSGAPWPGVPSWRPDHALAPATHYTLRVDVSGGPCGFGGGAVELALTTGDGTPTNATLAIDGPHTHDTISFVTSTGPDVCGEDGAVACSDVPEVCCARSENNVAREARAKVTVLALGVGGAPYHLLTVTAGGRTESYTNLGIGDLEVVEWARQVAAADPLASLGCVTATLTNLMEEREVARLEACPDASMHEAAPPLPPLVCNAFDCASHGDTTIVESSPEPTPEAAPDSDHTHDTIDDGCAGATAPDALIGLLLALVTRTFRSSIRKAPEWWRRRDWT